MFRKLKNFVTRHEHSFDSEEIETSFHFVRTGVEQAFTDNSFFGGTTLLYDGYWERIEEATEICKCGEHGESSREYKKVNELSNGERLIEILNDLALHGKSGYTDPNKITRAKVSAKIAEARRKLHGILIKI
jgi:hypothetical protein